MFKILPEQLPLLMCFYCPHCASKELRHRFSDLLKVVHEIDGEVGIKTHFITMYVLFFRQSFISALVWLWA